MTFIQRDTAYFIYHRCRHCDGTFTLDQWDGRHSDYDGEDVHAECCAQFGPCSGRTREVQ